MPVNKVIYGNSTLIDLTSDTVTADSLLQGYTAHDKSGALITGTASQTGGGVIDTVTALPNGGDHHAITSDVDLTQDTVAANKLLQGYTAHDSSGTAITGTYTAPSGTINISTNGTHNVTNYASANVNVPSGITPTGTISITTNGTHDVTNYASANVNVPGGSEEKVVFFYDYDGTVLYSYTKNEFLALSTLPANPSHSGLTARGWNWTLSDITDHLGDFRPRKIHVGQTYITASGKTEIDITFPAGALYLSPYLVVAVNGTVVIDWGDGSPTNTVNGSSLSLQIPTQHTYSSAGDYTITIECTSGSFTFYGTSTLGGIFGSTTTTTAINIPIASILRRLRLGSGITTIGQYAFNRCISFESITIPDTLTSFGQYAFYYCYSLKHIVFPKAITQSGTYVFNACSALKSVCINYGLTTLTNYTFYGCSALKYITIPNSVSNIGSNVFSSCYALNDLMIPDRRGASISIDTGANTPAPIDYETVNVPSGVTSISGYMFMRWNDLKEITLPATIDTIGQYAFYYCTSLKSVTMLGMTGDICSINSYAFYGCYSLESVVIPNGVKTINQYAFGMDYNLKSIIIPNSVTTIGTSVFYSCNALTSVTLPNSITSIASSLFQACYALGTITIPASVTSIGTQAFSNCSGLTEIHLLSSTPPSLANINAFTGIPEDCKIYVPAASLTTYQTTTNWSTYASYMVGE